LREAEGHVYADTSFDRHLGSPKPFRNAGILDEGVWNPGEHLLALLEHFLGTGIKIGKDFDRNARRVGKRRDPFDNPFVFPFLLFRGQLVAGNDAPLNLGIFGHISWVRGLSVEKAQEVF
jgi:hypothetical protein